jgi:hypothetical protein
MARQIYGADGSAQVVSTTGVPTVAAATVYTARTGGTIVTDIQNLSNANLGGVVTPDARGQIIFQGPDNSTATYWLDFGDGGPRWGVRPVDISAMMTAAMVARDLANYTTAGGFTAKGHLPYTANSPSQSLAAALDPMVVPRFASSGARDVAFPSPADGDRVYRTDLHAHQTYRNVGSASRWVTDPALIQEFSLAADTATISFTAIPQEWRNLVIKYRTKMVGSNSSNTIHSYFGVRFNSDSGTNYAHQGAVRTLKGVSGTLTYEVARDGTGAGLATTAGAVIGSVAGGIENFVGVNSNASTVGFCAGSGNGAGIFGSGEITIDEYTSSSNRKPIRGNSAFGDNLVGTGTGYMGRADMAGGWSNSAAITQIDLLPTSGTAFSSGSTFRLYGWS